MTESLSLNHLARPAVGASDRPPLLILLHGYGSNEYDLFGLAPYIDQRFVVVSVRAPYALPPSGYAWFELGFTASGVTFDEQQASGSRTQLLQFIGEAISAYNADPSQIYLLGFSQGAIMAFSVLLTEPEVLAGVVLLSGSVPQEALAGRAEPERLTGKPVLVTHGIYDPVLPIANGRASRDTLSALPVALEYHEYPMGHEVSAASLSTVAAWLAERLDGEI